MASSINIAQLQLLAHLALAAAVCLALLECFFSLYSCEYKRKKGGLATPDYTIVKYKLLHCQVQIMYSAFMKYPAWIFGILDSYHVSAGVA